MRFIFAGALIGNLFLAHSFGHTKVDTKRSVVVKPTVSQIAEAFRRSA